MIVGRLIWVSTTIQAEVTWLARTEIDCPWRKFFFPRKYRRLVRLVRTCESYKVAYRDVFQAERAAYLAEMERQNAALTA